MRHERAAYASMLVTSRLSGRRLLAVDMQLSHRRNSIFMVETQHAKTSIIPP